MTQYSQNYTKDRLTCDICELLHCRVMVWVLGKSGVCMLWARICLLLRTSCSIGLLGDLASGAVWLSLTLPRPLRLPRLLSRLLWARGVWVQILLVGIIIPFALIILTGCIRCVLSATAALSLLLLLLLLLSAAIRALAVASSPLAPLIELVTHAVQVNLREAVPV